MFKYLTKLILISAFMLHQAWTKTFTKNIMNCADPDCYATAAQLITKNGYPVEEYSFTTSDGYILGIQRIPSKHASNDGCQRLPILLAHGIFRDSRNFVANFKKNSLAFVLSDQGYDVWLFNCRGTQSSNKHVKYTIEDRQFWQFSFDEISLIDIAETIDFVLNKTNNEKLYYIGYSQGTTEYMALLSGKPEYNEKIEKGILLAPIALLSENSTENSIITSILGQAAILINYAPTEAIFPSREAYVSEIENGRCTFDPVRTYICNFASADYTGDININQTRLPVYYSFYPSGVSAFIIVQLLQVLHANKLQKLDYTAFGNVFHYSSIYPPAYDFSLIKVPTEIYSSVADTVSTPGIVNYVRKQIKSIVFDYELPRGNDGVNFSHSAFVFGDDSNRLVYTTLVERLNNDSKC